MIVCQSKREKALNSQGQIIKTEENRLSVVLPPCFCIEHSKEAFYLNKDIGEGGVLVSVLLL